MNVVSICETVPNRKEREFGKPSCVECKRDM